MNGTPAGGTAPPPPGLLVGRDGDLARLRGLLARGYQDGSGRTVTLSPSALKSARSQRGWTQDALAKAANTALRTVKEAETGGPILVRIAGDIAKALQVSIEDLLERPSNLESMRLVIRGLPGVGKTSVVAALAHDRELKKMYPDPLLWASLGQTPDPLAELSTWARALGAGDIASDIETARELNRHSVEAGAGPLRRSRERLSGLLHGRRSLIIIDDAWTDAAVRPLIVGGVDCAIVIATKVTAVADALATTEARTYVLDVLSDAFAVQLLRDLAGEVIEQYPDDALQLAQSLECLPLALQVAGRLLAAESRNGLGVHDLFVALKEPTSILPATLPSDIADDVTPTVAALLRKSTDVLTREARECFAYLAPYPVKPAQFELADLATQWDGLTSDPSAMARLLVSRGLLEPAGDGTFWLHSVLKAHAKTLLSPS